MHRCWPVDNSCKFWQRCASARPVKTHIHKYMFSPTSALTLTLMRCRTLIHSLADLHWIGLNLSVQVEIKAQDAFDCRSETGGNSLQALAVLSLVRDTNQQMLVALARQDQICFFVGKVNGLSKNKRDTPAHIDTEIETSLVMECT